MANSNAALHYDFHGLSREQRSAQTKMIMRLFDHWKLTYKQQSIMLGLCSTTQATISRYKLGKSVLSNARDIQDRVGHLLAIHRYLKTVYPYNIDLAYRWVTTQNADFENMRPYDVIAAKGYMGLVEIRQYLEMAVQA